MTTLTVTKARKNLGHWLRRAGEGEDIGIIDGDKIIALRPMRVESTDYAAREYGVCDAALERFVKRSSEEIAKARKAGKLKAYKGDLNALL